MLLLEVLRPVHSRSCDRPTLTQLVIDPNSVDRPRTCAILCLRHICRLVRDSRATNGLPRPAVACCLLRLACMPLWLQTNMQVRLEDLGLSMMEAAQQPCSLTCPLIWGHQADRRPCHAQPAVAAQQHGIVCVWPTPQAVVRCCPSHGGVVLPQQVGTPRAAVQACSTSSRRSLLH